jgi:biotin carboxyl carrier protein
VAVRNARARRPAARPPDPTAGSASADPRGLAERLVDHAAIGRLSEELLPALVAKLGASGLGEIEIREGAWKVRLRRILDPDGLTVANPGRRVTDRPSRPQPGHAGHGHAPGALEGHLPASGRDGHGSLAAVRPGRHGSAEAADGGRSGTHRAVATSPAVGIFQARPEMRPGTRVRAGDRIGHVDVLGVRQEVASPVDGILGATLVEPGDAVEYGQDLVRIELVSGAAPVGEAGS